MKLLVRSAAAIVIVLAFGIVGAWVWSQSEQVRPASDTHTGNMPNADGNHPQGK
jgi:hypothetical protein